MVTLHDIETGQPVGEIPDDQFQFLRTLLEEESSQDQDYYIDAATIDMLAASGGARYPELLGLLSRVLGGRDGVELHWSWS